MLSLRRGRVTATARGARRSRPARGRRRAVRRVPAPDRAGRGRRRRRRERPGAGARARLRRVRRAAREPDARPRPRRRDGAHVMKLPYTSLQFARRHGEEDIELPDASTGCPSSRARSTARSHRPARRSAGLRVAYVQLEGGALPVELSDSLRELRREGLLETTIGSGACFGGDVDCVNVYSGARGRARARRGRHRLRDRPRSRRHRDTARARRHGRGRRDRRRARARRPARPRRARLGRRPTRAPPRRVAPQRGGARARRRRGGRRLGGRRVRLARSVRRAAR